MRIAFLLSQDLESPSGLGRYWPVSKELSYLGHVVTILALHSNYAALQPGEKDFTREGVRVRYVGQMHVRKAGDRKLYFRPGRLLYVVLRATLHLTHAALRTPADAYHVGKPHPMNGLAGLIASRVRRKPLYLDCDDFEAASNRFGSRWQRQVVASFERALPRAALGATTNTRFMADRLLESRVPEERVVYVPNGVERSRFCSIPDGSVRSLRDELDLATKKVVLYLGSLSLVNHAVDLLLEAFATVRRIETDALLLVVGGGEDYDDLRAHAVALNLQDSVRFVGRVAPGMAPLYYRVADVSVDPVRDDLATRARSPLKVMESLASATPVVTGDVGDRCQLLADGGGLLVPAGDPAALAEALLTILKDEALYDNLCAESRVVRERYYWDKLVFDFAKIYSSTS